LEEILGKRLNGFIHKCGSVYGFVKTTDFEEPDLGEIFFLVREVQGKRRLPVGTKVTFVLDRKDEKMRALRVVPLSLPEEILKLEEQERLERLERGEDEEEEEEEKKKVEEKKQDKVMTNRRWKRDDDSGTSSTQSRKSTNTNRSHAYRDRSSRSPPFRPQRSPGNTPPGFRTTVSHHNTKWPYDPSAHNTSGDIVHRRPHHHHHHGYGRRVVENGGESHHHRFNNVARGPDGSKGFGGWRRRHQ
jgi:hypothetical protein